MNRILKLLFLYNGIFVLAGSLLGPLYALFVEQLNAGIFEVSISWSIYMASTTFFTFIILKIGDKFSHKRYLLAGGLIVRALCWFLLIFVSNIWQLYFIQFILGIGEALGTPAFDALFAEHLDNDKHIMDYSEWKVISNAVHVIGTLVGGFIVATYGFNYIFIIMSLLAVCSFIGVMLNSSIDRDVVTNIT